DRRGVQADHLGTALRPLEGVEAGVTAEVEDAPRTGAPLENRVDLLGGLATGVERALEHPDGSPVVEERIDAHAQGLLGGSSRTDSCARCRVARRRSSGTARRRQADRGSCSLAQTSWRATTRRSMVASS